MFECQQLMENVINIFWSVTDDECITDDTMDEYYNKGIKCKMFYEIIEV